MKLKYFYKSHLIRWLFSIIGLESPGIKQLLKELKFTVGEQYENYEFALEEQGSKTINGLTYEIYLYNKDDFQTLFGLPIKSILLYFNADTLSCVEYRFKGNQFDYLWSRLNNYLDAGVTKNTSKKGIYKLPDDVILEIIVKNEKITILSIQSIYYNNISSS